MIRRRLTIQNQPTNANRRGAVVLWFIVAMPVLLTLLCVVLEVSNLYLARQELKNSLEAAALAAVKDWGDNGGGNTFRSRRVGNAYAMANTINGVPVDLASLDPNLNYNFTANAPCNQNVYKDGVLVFGAITSEGPEFEFDCCQAAGCFAGTVQLDVSAQSALGGSNDEWGISYQSSNAPTNPPRIVRVVYTLPTTCNGQQPRFDFTSAIPVVSNALLDSQGIVRDQCPNNIGSSSQADVYGINPGDVQFLINVDPNNPCVPNANEIDVTNSTSGVLSRTLALQFPNANDGTGFDLYDRIRFGATVNDNGTGNLGGDDIGLCMTQVTICFSNGTSVTPCSAMFQDLNFKNNQCFPSSNQKCAGLAFWGINEFPGNPDGGQLNRGLIIHPLGIPDLPCPPASGQNNDGQSTATVVNCQGGGSGNAFAVRAQATYEVPSICCQLCGIPIGPFTVTAKADALYDCDTQRPRLYHLEMRNYNCALPLTP